MSSDRSFFSGETLAQALNQAAQRFQVEPAKIRYKVIEKRHGFLRARKKVLIEVDASNPTGGGQEVPTDSPTEAIATETIATETYPPEPSAEESSADESHEEPAAPAIEAEAQADPPDAEGPEESATPPAAERDPYEGPMLTEEEPGDGDSHVELPEAPVSAGTRFPAASGDEAEAAARALEKILSVSSLELSHKILQGEEQLEVELWGEDQDILLRDRGRLLLAIQHLLPRVIRGLIGRSVVCRVDSDSFHEIREERLRDMAQRAADEVRQGGRPRRLEPMSPDERRIVHLTLADYPGVETESQGSGLFKRVTVRRADDDRPYSR